MKGKPSSGKKGPKDENETDHLPPSLAGTGFLTWWFLKEDDFEELEALHDAEQLGEAIAGLAGCPL
ncbi:hypothetical protein HDU93_007057, partial [Gonapodya sp. JEL0774]